MNKGYFTNTRKMGPKKIGCTNGVNTPGQQKLEALGLVINFSYYCSVSPFRVFQHFGEISLKATCVSKMRCAILHLSAVVYLVLGSLYLEGRRDYEDGEPKVIFNFAYRAARLAFVLSTIRTFWCGREYLEAYLNGNMAITKTLPHPLWLNTLLMVGVIVLSASNMAYVLLPWSDQQGSFRYLLKNVGNLVMSNRTFDHGNVWWNLLRDLDSPGADGLVVVYLLLRIILYIIVSLGYAMVLVMAAAVYGISKGLSTQATTEEANGPMLVQAYGDAKAKIGLLNQAAHLSLLFLTAQFAIFTSLLLPGALQLDCPYTLAMIGIYIVTTGLTFLLAAEGNRKMRVLEKLIISSFPFSESSNAVSFLGNLPGENGLSGGDVFVMSYTFLGSMVTIIFTYVLVVQQLKAT